MFKSLYPKEKVKDFVAMKKKMLQKKDGFIDRQEHFETLKKLAEKSRRIGTPCPPLDRRGVKPFADPPQHVIEYTTMKREYHHPFHYKNIKVVAYCNDPSNSGLELNPVNTVDGRTGETDPRPGDYIELVEDKPIVKVVILGSACTPPGWVALEAEPVPGFRRPDEVEELMPLRFRIDNLWGTHVRGDCWMKETVPGGKMPQNWVDNWPYCHEKDFVAKQGYTQVTGENYPLAGMSCAIFEIPASRKVRIMGGSLSYGWTFDRCPGDNHYSFRMIRTEILNSYDAIVE